MFLFSYLDFDFKEYQHCFQKTKQKLQQDPNEKQFEFSEMYIFGKFETFHRRLAKIIDVFTTFDTYSVLQDSKIEGLEDIITKYQVLYLKKFKMSFLTISNILNKCIFVELLKFIIQA